MTAPSLSPGARLGPYEVESFLGSGGMGEVYRCRDTRLDRIVAVKILLGRAPTDRSRLERFHNEAHALSALTHPHIRALYDVGEVDGIDFLVMEYIEGQTLESQLRRRPLAVDQALRHAIQIAEALSAAHRRGLAHYDIKPANIMLTASGVKLLDFGLATLWSDLYSAPERLEGSACDARADIFAFGVVLYEMLTGRRPFDAPSRARLVAAILEHDPPSVSSLNDAVSPELERAVVKCLAKDPDSRWQTTADLASELTWITQRASPARAATAPRRAGRVAVAALFVVGLVGLLIPVGSSLTTRASVESPKAIRFLVEPPIGSPITVNPSAFVVSPDGNRIAFTAAYGGRRMLWVRALDSYDARPLPGTDDAWDPFWHPDSRRVGFFAGNRIRSVDVGSGGVLTIAELPANTPRGATASWGAGGDILIGTGPALLRVPGSGGAPTPVDVPDGTSEARYTNPGFLPDGRRFVYHLKTASPGSSGVYVGSLDASAGHRRVLESDTQAQYVEPGYLLYIKDGAFLVQRVEPDTLAARGAPLLLPERVSFFAAFNTGAFSASGRDVLAYRGLITGTELRWFDRTGRLLSPITSPAPYLNPALSPDGTRVAVTRFDPAVGTPDIWVIDSRGGATQLTSEAGIEEFATWSPDGSRVLFTSNRLGALDLFTKAWTANASDAPELLLADDQNKLPFQWRDRLILYASSPPFGLLNSRFFVKPTNGAAHALPASETATEKGQPQLSPDGRWMAYVSDVTGSPHVFVRPFPGGTTRWLISPTGGFEPKWRGDGRELFYLALDRTLMAVDVRADHGSFAAGSPRPLFRTNLTGAYLGAPFLNTRVRNEYEVSADGQRFLLNEPVEGPSAYAVRILVNWAALLTDR